MPDHGIWSHHFMANIWGYNGNGERLYFGGLLNHCRWWLQPWNQKTLASWRKSYDQPRQHVKKQRHYFANKNICLIKAMIFPVVMYGCDSWNIKIAECWRIDVSTVMLKKTFESSMGCKDIKLVNPKGNQSWIVIGRNDAEAQTPIVWPPDLKNWIIGKDPDAGKGWRQEEKRTTEDEMAGWDHQLDGHEFE